MKLITEDEIKLIDDLWVNPEYIKKRDRSYQTIILDSESIHQIISKWDGYGLNNHTIYNNII
jgi:hypothetical protein